MGRCVFACDRRRSLLPAAVWLLAALAIIGVAMPAGALARTRTFHLTTHVRIKAHSAAISSFGELDCNGHSTAQQSIAKTMNCTDVRGIAGVDNANTWGGRFYDNGHYIGHDEPDMTFLSRQSGSGNNVTWTETIPKDPPAPPTVKVPGSDVAHWFELSPAPWFSMAMCDSNSYPLLL